MNIAHREMTWSSSALGRGAGADLVTVAQVVRQAWRDGASHVHLARALPMIDVLDGDGPSAQVAGEVLRDSAGSDVVDALVALATRPGDQVLTGDAADLAVSLDVRVARRQEGQGHDRPDVSATDVSRRRSLVEFRFDV